MVVNGACVVGSMGVVVASMGVVAGSMGVVVGSMGVVLASMGVVIVSLNSVVGRTGMKKKMKIWTKIYLCTVYLFLCVFYMILLTTDGSKVIATDSRYFTIWITETGCRVSSTVATDTAVSVTSSCTGSCMYMHVH